VSPDVLSLVLSAQHLQAIRRYREAAALWAQAVATEPDDADLRCGWAGALFLAGEFQPAIETARSAVTTAPESTFALCVLGVLLTGVGQAASAVPLARQAVGLAPDSADAHVVLCLALLDSGQVRAAEETQRRLLELAPTASEVMQLVALTRLHDPGRRSSPEVEAWLQRALAADPHDSDAMTLLAVSQLFSSGGDRAGEAATVLDGALRVDPGNQPAQQLLSLTTAISVLRPLLGAYVLGTVLLALVPHAWRTGHVSWFFRVALILSVLTVPGLVRHARSRLAQLPPSARRAFRLWRRGYLLFLTVHSGLYGLSVLALYTAIDMIGGWLSVVLGIVSLVPALALAFGLALVLTRLITAVPGRT
jgi:tetratricopeptide (TPR) repeat protein